MTDAAPRLLPGTEEATDPFFSPDGKALGFFARGTLWRTSTKGGAPLPLASAPLPMGGTWGDDDSIVFAPSLNAGLHRVRAAGRGAELLLSPVAETEYACVWPRFLPGGRELLFTTWGGGYGVSRLSLPGLERAVMTKVATSSAYLPPGFLVFGGLQGGILAQPYESNPGSELPVPTSVLPSIYFNPNTEQQYLDVSRTGTVAFAPGDITQASLSRVNLAGRVEPTSPIRAAYQEFAPSRDGRRMAVVHEDRLWVQDLERGTETPLAPERFDVQSNPRWTPDGERIVFGSNQGGDWDIYERDAAGALPVTTLLEKELDQFPASFAPDGTLAFGQSHPDTGADIWLLSPDGTAEVWLATDALEIDARFSPDGRWLAYSSNRSGRNEVFVRSRSGGEQLQVSASGGTAPAWSPDGEHLFFRSGHKVLSVSIRLAPDLAVGQPEVLFDGGWALASGPIEVAPSGQELFMVHREPAAIPDRIDLIFKWADEVRKLVEPGDAP